MNGLEETTFDDPRPGHHDHHDCDHKALIKALSALAVKTGIIKVFVITMQRLVDMIL